MRLVLSQPERTSNGWHAHITVIDVFGNLSTDLPAAALEERRDITLKLCGRQVEGIVDSYGHRLSGELVALVDSEGFVEVAVVNGSAARLLNAQLGDIVEVALGYD